MTIIRCGGSPPRVRGIAIYPILPTSETGSPPRVRGIARQRILFDHAVRFTPACAGNRPSSPPSRGRCPVHPRVCGEYLICWRLRRPKGGSSPRVRGIRPRMEAFRVTHHGSSPRVRGIRRRPCQTDLTDTVHPRVCGEYSNISLPP